MLRINMCVCMCVCVYECECGNSRELESSITRHLVDCLNKKSSIFIKYLLDYHFAIGITEKFDCDNFASINEIPSANGSRRNFRIKNWSVNRFHLKFDNCFLLK